MGYSAKAPANYFIGKYGRFKISPLKLQKLVYISHGWHLAIFDRELVDDEYAEAWQYGPVFPSLYHEFTEFGANPMANLERFIPTQRTHESDELQAADDAGLWHYKEETDHRTAAVAHRQGYRGSLRAIHSRRHSLQDYNTGMIISNTP